VIKRIVIFILLVSFGFNIYFLIRKIDRIQRLKEIHQLRYYKDINYQDGYNYFTEELEKKYPETMIGDKHYIVFQWDSTAYDIFNKDQMRVLDSMADDYGNYKLEYVFVTEMEEAASKSFLNRNNDDFKHVKMLYGMDDYISGLYSNKDVKIPKHKQFFSKNCSPEDKEKMIKMHTNMKRKPFYVIMNSKGKVLYNNRKIWSILKDSLFLNKLKTLTPNKSIEILN